MLNSETFIKTRTYFAVCLFIAIFPITVIIVLFYKAFECIFQHRNLKNISGDISVVTGSGHGLGRCIAIELAKRGSHVAVVDMNLEGAEKTVELIKAKHNVKCKAYKVDVTDYKQVENLNNEIKTDLGIATILVNNAGILTLSSFAKPECEEIQRMINVNLSAHFWTNRVFLENMKEVGRGHITAISSIAGMFPLVFNSVYCATKFGVRGMMKSLRLDLQTLNLNDIKTTIVYPWFLATNDAVVDISKQTNVNDVYPLLRGEDAAYTIVNAMLRDEEEIVLPAAVLFLHKMFDFFPASIQDMLWHLTGKPFMPGFKKIYKKQEQELRKTN